MASNELERKVNAIVRRLGSLRKSTREQAERELKALGPDAVEQLVRRYKVDLQLYKANNRFLSFIANSSKIYACIMLLLWISTFGLKLPDGNNHLQETWCILMTICFLYIELTVLCITVPVSTASMQRRKRMIAMFEVICRNTTAVSADAVVYSLEMGSLKIIKSALAYIERMLVNMGRSEFDSLFGSGYLVRILLVIVDRNHDDENGLLIDLLGALSRIGEKDAITFVRQIVRKKSVKSEPQIYDAASSCLQALTDRLERERPARTLLRPSEAPESSTLLRPAGNAPTDDALLRPVEAPNAEQPLGGARGE